MLSLPALSQKYKSLYPEYIDPLAKFSPGDPILATIKRQALSPYLSSLEEQRILYNDHILVSAFLFDIEVNENGFIAELWKIKTLQLPDYPYPFRERKTWIIQCDWQHLRLLGNRMNGLHYGWCFSSSISFNASGLGPRWHSRWQFGQSATALSTVSGPPSARETI